jgi:hypothetical protein
MLITIYEQHSFDLQVYSFLEEQGDQEEWFDDSKPKAYDCVGGIFGKN